MTVEDNLVNSFDFDLLGRYSKNAHTKNPSNYGHYHNLKAHPFCF